MKKRVVSAAIALSLVLGSMSLPWGTYEVSAQNRAAAQKEDAVQNGAAVQKEAVMQKEHTVVQGAAMGSETSSQQTRVSRNQAPVLSGVTRIQIAQGEVFDAEDILNRVFAMDYEDGDLTKEIRIVKEDVNPAQIGTYTVTYEVADRENAKDTMTTIVEVAADTAEEGQRIQRTLYSKEDAAHLLKVQLYRGYYHDRQHLGVYLNAGTSFQIRLVNGQEVRANAKPEERVKLNLLGDDSAVEKEYEIPYDGSWLTVPAKDLTVDLVPFIRTLQSDVQPVVEYYYVENGMEALTYYSHGDDEAAFFSKWESNDQKYAVIEGERITMLIPRRDKDSILNNTTTREEYRFTSLDQMLDYYKALQDQYDQYAGLVFDADAGTDKNVRAKYFAKADAHGVGAAYYSAAQYTAENAYSMNGYLKRDWMTMHELAHGYDSSLAYGNLPLVECINNMFGYFYEKNTLAEGDQGWSSLQNFELVEQRYMDQIKNGKTFNNMNFDARLYGMLNALTVSDPQKMMSDLYRGWRQDGGVSGCADFLVEHFSDTSGYNLVPYFEEYGFPISELVKNRIYEKNYPIANRFMYHFQNKTQANAAKAVIGDQVNGFYGLTVPEELANLKLTGDIEVHVKIDDLMQIKGKEIRILDGEKVVAKAAITKEEIRFEKLPVGTYRLELPNTKQPGYYTEYTYVTVVADKCEVFDAEYVKNTNNLMKDDAAIVLQGLSDTIFSTVSTNIAQGTITVTTEGIQPHYYFSEADGAYGTITVTSPDGKVLYTRSYIGNQTYQYEQETFDAQIGSKVIIKHKEIGGAERRVKVKSNLLDHICKAYMDDYNTADYTVTFVVTENGLKRADWNENTFRTVRGETVSALLAFLDETEYAREDRNAYQKVKAMAVGMIQSFEDEVQQEYKETYAYLFEEETMIEPTPMPSNPFDDVKETDYYYTSVLWAVEHEITTGWTKEQFAPDGGCTRGQVVTFLWRAAGKPEAASGSKFTDIEAGAYYYNAVLWAVEHGITNGVTATKFEPNTVCTRGQIVTFLWRAAEKELPESNVCKFTDVNANAYYYDAVRWAVEHGITTGVSDTRFEPEAVCTRGQIVTFLYRANH